MVEPAPAKQSQKLKINVDDILDRFDCPICMCKLTEPYIAKCGHTFCKVTLTSNNFIFPSGLHIRMCEQVTRMPLM